MPNITVRVSDVDYRAARIWAAARGLSVSAIVRRILQNLPAKEQDIPGLISSLSEHLWIPAPQLNRYMLPQDDSDPDLSPELDDLNDPEFEDLNPPAERENL